MSQTPFNFPAMLPEMQEEVVLDLDVYSKQALSMTCRSYCAQWTTTDEEALKKLNNPYFIARHADERILEWSFEYFSMLRDLRREFPSPWIALEYRNNFLVGICVRGDTELFTRLMNIILPPGYNADATQVLELIYLVCTSNNREMLCCLDDLCIPTRTGSIGMREWTKLRLILQPPPDVEPNIDLVLEFFRRLPLDRFEGFGGDIHVPGLQFEKPFLSLCLELRCIPTLVACCEKEPTLKTFYQANPDDCQDMFDENYVEYVVPRGPMPNSAEFIAQINFLKLMMQFRPIYRAIEPESLFASINNYLRDYQALNIPRTEEDLVIYWRELQILWAKLPEELTEGELI